MAMASVAEHNRGARNYETFGQHSGVYAAPTGMDGLVDTPEIPVHEPPSVRLAGSGEACDLKDDSGANLKDTPRLDEGPIESSHRQVFARRSWT